MSDFSFKEIIDEYFKNENSYITISKEQEKFLNENKGKLFEYYGQVSDPKKDNFILGNIQIWVYGSDRIKFTPHCHIMLADKSIEFEVDLLNFEVINVKSPKGTNCSWNSFSNIKKPFFKWLELKNNVTGKNIYKLYSSWDQNNPRNTLIDFIAKHNIENLNKDLFDYVKASYENN